jgi:2-polyprenyl-3-methyl-5-hydroxy-6-metoxy-1,4-benzoquinol methylase
MTLKNNCNVCKKNNFFYSKKNIVTDNSKTNWEHESTAELANVLQKEFYMGFCLNCWSSKIFPDFDTNLIYQKESGYQSRKKYFEKYNFNKNYYNLDDSSIKKKNKLIANELKRVESIMKDFNFFLNNNFKNIENLKILDFGGADGYLSNIIIELNKLTTNKKISLFNYDPQFENKVLGKKYDFIIISHVLEHVHDLESIFHSIKNVTTDNSVIFVEVPDERFLLFKKYFLKEKVFLHYHVNYFLRKSLNVLFNINDFKTNFSYKLSSYRGNNLTVISGYAGKKINNFKLDLLYECFSIFKYIYNKVIAKIRNL